MVNDAVAIILFKVVGIHIFKLRLCVWRRQWSYISVKFRQRWYRWIDDFEYLLAISVHCSYLDFYRRSHCFTMYMDVQNVQIYVQSSHRSRSHILIWYFKLSHLLSLGHERCLNRLSGWCRYGSFQLLQYLHDWPSSHRVLLSL